VVTVFLLVLGILGYFITNIKIINEMSVGLLVLGVSFLGLLKSQAEVFENHRIDKNALSKTVYPAFQGGRQMRRES